MKLTRRGADNSIAPEKGRPEGRDRPSVLSASTWFASTVELGAHLCNLATEASGERDNARRRAWHVMQRRIGVAEQAAKRHTPRCGTHGSAGELKAGGIDAARTMLADAPVVVARVPSPSIAAWAVQRQRGRESPYAEKPCSATAALVFPLPNDGTLSPIACSLPRPGIGVENWTTSGIIPPVTPAGTGMS
jgi:hypothetical protein